MQPARKTLSDLKRIEKKLPTGDIEQLVYDMEERLEELNEQVSNFQNKENLTEKQQEKLEKFENVVSEMESLKERLESLKDDLSEWDSWKQQLELALTEE